MLSHARPSLLSTPHSLYHSLLPSLFALKYASIYKLYTPLFTALPIPLGVKHTPIAVITFAEHRVAGDGLEFAET